MINYNPICLVLISPSREPDSSPPPALKVPFIFKHSAAIINRKANRGSGGEPASSRRDFPPTPLSHTLPPRAAPLAAVNTHTHSPEPQSLAENRSMLVESLGRPAQEEESRKEGGCWPRAFFFLPCRMVSSPLSVPEQPACPEPRLPRALLCSRTPRTLRRILGRVALN